MIIHIHNAYLGINIAIMVLFFPADIVFRKLYSALSMCSLLCAYNKDQWNISFSITIKPLSWYFEFCACTFTAYLVNETQTNIYRAFSLDRDGRNTQRSSNAKSVKVIVITIVSVVTFENCTRKLLVVHNNLLKTVCISTIHHGSKYIDILLPPIIIPCRYMYNVLFIIKYMLCL